MDYGMRRRDGQTGLQLTTALIDRRGRYRSGHYRCGGADFCI